MTQRDFFVLIGLFMWVTSSVFFCTYRRGTAPAWIARALRALMLIPWADGLKLWVVNLRNVDKPVKYSDWIDASTSFGLTGVKGIATFVFFAVFINVRRWP